MVLKRFLFLILITACAAHNGRGRGSGRSSSNCHRPSSPQKTSSTTVVRNEVQRPVINIDSSLIEKPLSLLGSLLDRIVKPINDQKNAQNTNRNNNRNPNTGSNPPEYPDSEEVIPPQNRKPTKEEFVQRIREHVARDKEMIENKKETLLNNRNAPKSVSERNQDDDSLKNAHWYRPFTQDDTYDMYDYNEMDDRFK